MNNKNIDQLLNQYPKTRSLLPKKIRDIYALHYQKNRDGKTPITSIAQKMERWLHKMVAKDLTSTLNQSTANQIDTLEIGAGSLNQLPYEPQSRAYDIVEPFTDLYRNNPDIKKVRNIYQDITEIPEHYRYDRITTIATLEHIINLPYVIAKSAIHLKQGGSFRVAIPNEGTILWHLGWKLTTGIEFRLKYGVDYSLLMKHEHINTSKEIISLLKHFFHDCQIKYFGLTPYFAFYLFINCKKPNYENCQSYLTKKMIC